MEAKDGSLLFNFATNEGGGVYSTFVTKFNSDTLSEVQSARVNANNVFYPGAILEKASGGVVVTAKQTNQLFSIQHIAPDLLSEVSQFSVSDSSSRDISCFRLLEKTDGSGFFFLGNIFDPTSQIMLGSLSHGGTL